MASCSLHHGCDDARRHPLSVAYDGVGRLFRQVAYEVDSLVDALEVLEQRVHGLEHLYLLLCVRDDCVDQLVVAFHHCIVRLDIARLSRQRLLRSVDELVGDAAEGGHDYNHRLFACLYNLFYTQNAFCGTHGCSAKFHYFHLFFYTFYVYVASCVSGLCEKSGSCSPRPEPQHPQSGKHSLASSQYI